jgi:ABC-2 type transport system ATP-binding protein
MNEVLQVTGLEKHYPGFQLQNVSFSLEAGTITGLIGRNGAGKSTTLKALLNMVHPDGGEIRFWGKTFPQGEEEIKGQVGFVTGGVNYYPKKKLRDITAVTARFYPTWSQERYLDYCARFQLDQEKSPSQLSAGMQVKYALALALSHRARLLILDEPTSGLDPVSREELLEVFLQLVREEGVTILFSTHITSDLEKCAGRILYLKKGTLRGDQPLDDFRDQYLLAHLGEEERTPQRQAQLIGPRPSRRGVSGLWPRDKAVPHWLTAEKATLEDVMVHLEQEGEG